MMEYEGFNGKLKGCAQFQLQIRIEL